MSRAIMEMQGGGGGGRTGIKNKGNSYKAAVCRLQDVGQEQGQKQDKLKVSDFAQQNKTLM